MVSLVDGNKKNGNPFFCVTEIILLIILFGLIRTYIHIGVFLVTQS